MSYKLTESQKAARARFESALAKIPRIESMSLPVLPPPDLTVRDVPTMAWTEGEFYSAEQMRAAILDERRRCASEVFLTRMLAEQPDAPDYGLSGWLKEAEAAITKGVA